MSGERFVRFAEAVGNLGHPFLDEERQRDVWNEANAVGLQTVTWLGSAASAVALWIGGWAAVPYALAMIAVLAAGSIVTRTYLVLRLGETPVPLVRPSLRHRVILGVSLLFWMGGGLRALWGHAPMAPTIGGAVAGGVLMLVMRIKARRQAVP